MTSHPPEGDDSTPSHSPHVVRATSSPAHSDDSASDDAKLAEEFARLKPEESGDRIGSYKLLQEIGQGGFGVVWLAEQDRPVKRRVALKIIKLGMDTREVIGRFEQERQALAMMDCPNIAKVFDAGATQWGRLYFVMELVKGIPITQFCDEKQLTTRERLVLFMDVCAAINHAHQKGIIHRDIKPSNVLVALGGPHPVVKVIDFGIAKATLGRLTDKTLFTQFEQFIGTPAYTSPEQAALSVVDIDTRSDIYALGVLLYELLTGKPPFDPQSLLSGGYDEMRRIIREVEPPKPSVKLSTLSGEEKAALAKARHTAPDKLGKLVEPDLDWIVMKAIEKDRGRRYETADGLAMDVQRYLNQEPVVARPPATTYRMRKFVRRHQVGVATAAFVTVFLISATAFSWWQLGRARFAEHRQRVMRENAERLNVQLLRTRADLYGRQGKWHEAEEDLSAALALDPSDHWDWLRFATLLVQNKKADVYRAIRPQMLASFHDTHDPKIADRIAKASLLLPATRAEAMHAKALADRAVMLGANDSHFAQYYHLTAALAAYRAEQWEESKKSLETVFAQGRLDVNIRGLVHVENALVLSKLGQTEDAQEARDEADEEIDRLVDVNTGNLQQNYWQTWWHDWLILQILRQEASAIPE